MDALVYCWKCGAENEEEAESCSSCGARLKPRSSRVYRRRFEEDLCFEPGRAVHLWGVFFGLLVILVGGISLLSNYVTWDIWGRLWPFLVILFGLFVIATTLKRR